MSKDRNETQSGFCNITPAGAERLLAASLAAKWTNRSVLRRRVLALAEEMRSGRWAANGESIVIGPKGEVLDGQHRLHAVIEAGCTIRAMIVRGADPAHFHTFDSGSARTAGDVLHMAGLAQVGLRASLGRFLYAWERDELDAFFRHAQPKIANGTVLEALQRHPGLDDSLSYGNAAAKGVGKAMHIAAAHYLAARANQTKADAFFKQVVYGENIAIPDPAFFLRRRLIATRGRGLGSVASWEAWAMIVKSWNYYTLGRKIRELRIRPKEGLPEMRLVDPWRSPQE